MISTRDIFDQGVSFGNNPREHPLVDYPFIADLNTVWILSWFVEKNMSGGVKWIYFALNLQTS